MFFGTGVNWTCGYHVIKQLWIKTVSIARVLLYRTFPNCVWNSFTNRIQIIIVAIRRVSILGFAPIAVTAEYLVVGATFVKLHAFVVASTLTVQIIRSITKNIIKTGMRSFQFHVSAQIDTRYSLKIEVYALQK